MPKAGKPPERKAIRYCGGEMIPYQRPNTSVWWVRLKKPDGTWTRVSTGCSDEGAAVERGIALHAGFRFRHDHGLTDTTRSFRHAADELIKKLETKAEKGERSEQYVKNARNYLQRYPCAFFGDKPIDQITTVEVNAFVDWRENYWTEGPGAGEKQAVKINGRTVERTTKHGSKPASGEYSWLSMCFDTAIAKGWLQKERKPDIKPSKEKSRRRPAFSTEDIRKLEAAAPEWLRDGKGGEFFRTRYLTICFYYGMLTSGLRTGEAMSLQWKHLMEAMVQGKNVRYIYISRGKTGDRQSVPLDQFFEAIEAIREINPFQDDDDKIFATHDHEGKKVQPNLANSFLRWLKFAGVTNHANGDPFTLYCLRHSYITGRLTGGLSTHMVAKNVGTSTEMLDRHYSHLSSLLAADDLVRVNSKDQNGDGML